MANKPEYGQAAWVDAYAWVVGAGKPELSPDEATYSKGRLCARWDLAEPEDCGCLRCRIRGVATLAGPISMFRKSAFAPLVLILLGVVFLLSNLGLLPHLGPLFARWWPLILIIAGVSMLTRRL